MVQGVGELTASLLLEVHVITGGSSEIKSLYIWQIKLISNKLACMKNKGYVFARCSGEHEAGRGG